MIGNIIAWCVLGLLAGVIARILTPGADPMGCLGTIVIGVLGSLVGGYLAALLFGRPLDEFEPAGILGSIVGGIIVLLLLRALRRPVG